MNYKVDVSQVKITVYSTITKKLKALGHRTIYKNYCAMAEWEVGGILYGVNAEGDTQEEAYIAVRNKLRKRGLPITRANIISWEQ